MRNLVLISFTGKDAPGGVPRWTNDFIRCFPTAISYCWNTLVEASGLVSGGPQLEWEKASTLNWYLRHNKKIDHDDIIVVDGFWGKGLEDFPNVVSVCHGIWSHLIKEEADTGKKPDFPLQHAIQVDYRRKHLARGGRLVAVSEFIQHQMKIQWGFESTVINNAIDLDKFKPSKWRPERERPVIIHGVNDRNNPVKGWDHIQHIEENIGADVWSLDEAFDIFRKRHGPVMIKENEAVPVGSMTKYEALSYADLVVIPSAYEGNSYFALETLACDVPVVAYDVGLFWEMSSNNERYEIVGDLMPGLILDRRKRNKEETVDAVECFLRLRESKHYDRMLVQPRNVAKRYSLDKFHEQWKKYLEQEFNYVV